MNRKGILLGWIKIIFGLLVFALGVHFTIRANLGLAPWDCLGTGISLHTPLNYGLSMTVMGVIILFIDILMKEKSALAPSSTLCSPGISCSSFTIRTRSRKQATFSAESC